MNRRDFLASFSTASAVLAGQLSGPARALAAEGAAESEASHRFHGPYGLELYSLRNQMLKDPQATLDRVRRIGYTEVEVVYQYWGHLTVPELHRHVKKAGLRCTSVFYPGESFQNHFDEVLRSAHLLGVDYVICGSIPGAFSKKRLTLDDYRRGAADMNEWAERLRRSGFRLGYHNHNYEFRLFDGRPAYNTLIDDTKPGLVDFEMDIFWVEAGGQDPLAYLKRYPSRFKLIHLKDMRKGTPIPTFSISSVSEEASVPLGTGIIDIPAILRESARIGVRRYYVEDESREAPANIKISFEYLKHVRF